VGTTATIGEEHAFEGRVHHHQRIQTPSTRCAIRDRIHVHYTAYQPFDEVAYMTDRPPVAVVPFEAHHRAGCAAVFATIPQWFGIEASNRAYLDALPRLASFVALMDGEVVGFVVLEEHTPVASEVHVLAVAAAHHRRGLGRALLRELEKQARARGHRLVHVKTLGPSDPDPSYAMTRAFYELMGFLPLFETSAFWGEGQPTLVMVKVLQACSGVGSRR